MSEPDSPEKKPKPNDVSKAVEPMKKILKYGPTFFCHIDLLVLIMEFIGALRHICVTIRSVNVIQRIVLTIPKNKAMARMTTTPRPLHKVNTNMNS